MNKRKRIKGKVEMQSHEEKKARMRAYYRANKHKWKKYNREALARMSEDERAAYKAKQRDYYRKHYRKNREAIIRRTSEYQQKNREKFALYRAEWYQSNKPKIAARRRKHYHEVVKPRQQEEKSNSEFVTVSEAVNILGAKLRTFREWVYQGRIDSVRTPTGRYLLRRADVEDIRSNIKHIPEKIRKTLGLSRNGGEQ